MPENKQKKILINRGPGQGPINSSDGMQNLTPKEILGIVHRHVYLIIIFTILGGIAGGTGWYFMRKYNPKYTSNTYIEVLPPGEKDPMEISDRATNKDEKYAARKNIAMKITQRNNLDELLNKDSIQATKWFKKQGKNRSERFAEGLDDLKGSMGVHAHREADYVTVSMTCGDPSEAALIVNEMVDMFVSKQGHTKRGDIQAKLSELNKERSRLERELEAAEQSLAEVRETTGFTNLDQENNENDTLTEKLNDLEIQQNQLILQIKQISANIKNLERQATGPVNEQIENQIENDPTMIMLGQQLAMRQAELQGYMTKFGENHRVVRETTELIQGIRDKRALRKAEIAEQTRQSNLKNAQDQLTVLQSRYEELASLREEVAQKKQQQDSARTQYEERKAIRDERREMRDQVKQQIEKMKIMLSDPETPKVAKVGEALPPLRISSPKLLIYGPGGTMLGLMLGVGLAFLFEFANDLLKTPRDVSRQINAQLLGVIPDKNEDRQTKKLDSCEIVQKSPYSIISESYRRLRTNLKMLNGQLTSRSLLITSPMPGDGKTSVAVNLAMTLVAENKKVLLLDANFWKPTLHKNLCYEFNESDEEDDKDEFGLSTLLVGLCGYEEVIRSSGIEGLDVIDAGIMPSNPAELLSGSRMEQLIKQQKKSYDYVLIDGPPVLLVSESKVLAKLVDDAILVFNANNTRKGMAQRTVRELKEVNTNVTGCVLYSVKSMRGGYFQEHYKRYNEYQKSQLARAT